MPIASNCAPASRIPVIAATTAAKPSSGVPRADIGERNCCRISPCSFTTPAATLVPPISTPKTFTFHHKGTATPCACPFLLLEWSVHAHSRLHLFERHAAGLRINRKHHEELKHGHDGEKQERIAAGARRHGRKDQRDQRIHEPVREAAQALPFAANIGGKNFAEINPDHRPLGESKETDERDKERQQ